MRCSASQMFVDNSLMKFEALILKMTNTFINRLTLTENAFMKVFLDNMIVRDSMSKY